MARKIITITIGSSTTAIGPYNVYTTSISDDNLLESNVSLANMKTGRTYRVNTDINQVVITNENNDCCCSTKIISLLPPPPTPSPTTAAPTTAAPTTAAPTTATPTAQPTTAAPTTATPTAQPTTAAPTTAAPTTAAPTTAAPTTSAPTTSSPTTAAPTTAAPTTAAPTTPYFYYSVKKYDCSNFCAYVSPDLVARSSTALSTIDGIYYKVGSFTYQVQTEVSGPTYNVDLDSVTGFNADCTTACGATNYNCPSIPGSCYASLAECEATGCVNCGATVCVP